MNFTTKLLHYLSFLAAIFMLSCDNNSKSLYPPEPEISLISMSGDSFRFSQEDAGILFRLSLRDGDKDMGNGDKDSVIIFEDIRTDTIYQTFYLGLPNIPRETIDGPTLKATIDVPLRAFNFVPRSDTVHLLLARDTMVFRIYVEDEAGNSSNVITTDTIYILP